ncbi:MAG TPA: carboxypeptidase-like regulatory domain-containing protein [Kofleriaceae bacterium]|nr:carboxypeptidase-like regulatory domain-containing protein [Kofleriaceae bacterium]
MRFLLVLVVVWGTACGGTQTTRRRATDGAITGLTRDGDNAEPLGTAHVRLQGPNAPDAVGVSGRDGMYTIDHVLPGRYTVVGTYAGQTVKTTNVVVDAGEATYVDILFTPGRPEPYEIDYSEAKLREIKRFRSKDAHTQLEGTLTDAVTHVRIPGAVVTAFGPAGPSADTLQTITGDDGRYKFEQVQPGVYVVSAYYSVGGRGQIEVRRSDIQVESGDDVDVPLFIDTTRR